MPKTKLPGSEPSEVTLHFINEVNRVSGDPRLSILVINGFMELLVNILIRKKLKHGKRIEEDSRGYPYSTKIIILNEIGIINDELFNSIDNLRKLRNDAAHQTFFEIKDSDLDKFKPIVLGENEWKQMVEKQGICGIAILIWGCLWNQYTEIYLEAFGEKQ